MENVHFTLASEAKLWSMVKYLVIETAVVAESSLFWLMLTLDSLRYNVGNLDAFSMDKILPSRLIEEPKNRDVENMDEGKVEDDVDHKRQRTNYNAEDTADAFDEQWSDDDYEGDYDEDDSGDQQGTDGDGEDDDEDDDDSFEEDSSEEDEDEYEEEDDEDEEDEYEEEGSTSTDCDDTSSSDENMDDNPLLRHARKVYSYDSFCAFEHEYRMSEVLSCDVIEESCGKNGLVFKYKIGKPRHFDMHYNVTAIAFDGIVNCSCNYFSIVGILCSHAISVLQCLRIQKIPDRYLLKWRMKSSPGSSSMHKVSFLRGRQHLQSSDDCLRVILDKSSVEATISKDDSGTDFDYIVAPLLRHAKSVCISEIYWIFRAEYKKSKYLVTHFAKETIDQRGIVADCIVHKPGHIRNFKVHAEATDGTVNCSCRKFDLSGILCSHALAVLECLCIVRIPTQYILQEYMKCTNICGQEKIHGPRFAEFKKFTCYKVMHDHLDTLRRIALGYGQFNLLEHSEAKMKDDMLTQLKGSSDDKKIEESASSSATATQKNAVKGKARFYDDQLIKKFTYKESESKRKPLFPYFHSLT